MSKKLPTDTAGNATVARAALALMITMVAMKIHAEVNINFSSSPNAINQQSTGVPLDTSFTFELGTFANNFTPTATNTDEWSANWVVLNDAGGNPASGATTDYRTIAGLFGPYEGFASTTTLVHNDSPFDIGKQAYIWGFNGTGTGTHEWVLITNDLTEQDGEEWTVPLGTDDLSFTETWDVAGADNAIVGNINFTDEKDDEIGVETASVTVGGSPVPEPSTALILGTGAAMLGLRRRRRRRG
jgi:hypothetical protein